LITEEDVPAIPMQTMAGGIDAAAAAASAADVDAAMEMTASTDVV
jgi:hypothetical protein